jgi:hypothetical protein
MKTSPFFVTIHENDNDKKAPPNYIKSQQHYGIEVHV